MDLVQYFLNRKEISLAEVLETPPQVLHEVLAALLRYSEPPENCEEVMRRYGQDESKVLSRPHTTTYSEDEVPLGDLEMSQGNIDPTRKGGW